MVGSPREKVNARRKDAFQFRLLALAALIATVSLAPQQAHALELDQMSLERWKVLREVERYQLNIAERHYGQKEWKIAASEYEKYLTLYERSEGASYAQLKWSICQVHLRKANTAIKEGFQSVIDYWPESADATSAAYFIARTYKDIGRIPDAKKAYKAVLKDHEKHLVAVLSMVDLIDIAGIENDEKTRVDLWKKLTFDVTRTKENNGSCVWASQQLTTHFMYAAAFDDAVKSLATTYSDTGLTGQVVSYSTAPIRQLVSDSQSNAKGENLVTRAIAYVRGKIPTDLSDDANKQVAKQHWYYIADLHAAARHVDDVPKTYEQMEKVFGPDDEMLSRLAAWYKSENRYDDARATYRRYKDRIEGLNQVAYSHRQQSKPDLAVTVYNQLAGLDPEGIVRWKSEIAGTYRAANQYKEAIDTYHELLKLDIENSEKWRWQIASAHQDAGQYKEAIGHYRQCTNFPENYKQMAWCHRRLKQFDEALLLYNQVVGGHEGSAPWGLFQIGMTREEAEQKEQAIKAFQIVCKRFPKDPHASQAHARLQSKYGISITLGGATDE